MSNRIWILGAADPEMEMIEALLRQCGERVEYALVGTHPQRFSSARADWPEVAAFVAAAQIPGVRCGWGDDGCWYLSGPLQGPVCAHDPYGEIAAHLPEGLARQQWPDAWDGVIRQPYAFLRAQGHAKTQQRAIERAHRGAR